MEMRSIRGKNIVAAGYDPVSGTLRTKFSTSGEYDYSGVPEEKYVSLCRVPYPDKYYTQVIKGKYPCVKVEDLPEETCRTKAASLISEARPPICTDVNRAQSAAVNTGAYSKRSQMSSSVTTAAITSQSPARQTRIEMEVYKPEDGMAFVEQENGKECHYYTLNGERIPFSLTQILEVSGMSRKPTQPSEIAARPAKAKLGTKVHEYTLWLDQGELDLDDLKPYPAYYNRVLGWQQFKEDYHFEPDLTSCEIPMGVRLNGMLWGMKLDAYGIVTNENGKISDCVVEKKCTAQTEVSHQLQTAAQAIAFKDAADRNIIQLRRFCVYLFEKENAAKRFYKLVEHVDRMDEKMFIGAALTNAYWRFNNGLLK